MNPIHNAIGFWKRNIILSNIVHLLGGFALAIILQNHFGHAPFIPVIIAWLMMTVVLAAHFYGYIRGGK